MNDIKRELITSLFKHLLGRQPDENSINFFENIDNFDHMIFSIMNSTEYKIITRHGPLWNYASTFDAVKLIISKENKNRSQVDGHRVNYLGVAVNVGKFFPNLDIISQGLEDPPIPGNWHADIAEFAAVFRAVDFADRSFRMVELGCGWGCWMNISGMAARLSGKDPYLIGIEGDLGHIAFAKESLQTNGFLPHQFRIINGIASARPGTALFPNQNTPGVDWGLAPIFGASNEEISRASERGSHTAIQMVSMAEFLSDGPKLDLLHIDIQGGEADLIESTLDHLNGKVAYIVVGTHSRSIEGKIIDVLSNQGDWTLEIERPCVFSLTEQGATTQIDGVQGWRNNRLISRA